MDWDKLDHINDRMSRRLSCQDCLDKLQRPVAVFLTMETEEGKCRAEEYNRKVQRCAQSEFKTFLGSHIDVHESSEPTDIIWENRHFSDTYIHVRAFLFLLMMLGILSISFMIVFSAQKKSLAMRRKYPHQDCREVEQQYENQYQLWMKQSIKEYHVNSMIEENGGIVLYTGPLQCFCKEEKKRKHSISQEYELVERGELVLKEPICYNMQ